MINPGLALIIASLTALFLGLILWPEKGILARRQKSKQSGKRVLMEDALKYIYDAESRNINFDLNSLAKSLQVSPQETEEIIARLKSLGLLQDDHNFRLTTEGKDYALRVLRIHRLWERYLAEETGVPEKDWHKQAEVKEHKMTMDEANELSRYLGYPRYDPHGDPIPTRTGDLPPKRGGSLTRYAEGDIVRIVHIEDEPPELYEEIVSKGIYLENHIEILKKLDKSLHILTNGESVTLSIRLAKNITAVPSIEYPKEEETYQTLSSIAPGEKARVVRISKACRGTQRRRLMDLGIVPGTIISAEMISAGGDPTAYKIRGAVIALRKDQAQLINIEPLKEAVKNVN